MSNREKIIGLAMVVMIIISAVIYFLPAGDQKAAKLVTTPKGGTQAAARPAGPRAVRETAKDDTSSDELFDLKKAVEVVSVYNTQEALILKRDPFEELKPNVTELSFSDLVLTGLNWELEKPTVIINNQILHEGDSISGFVVDEIRKDEVLLIKSKRWYVLKFNQ